jgi:hypothetical protein
MNREEGATNRSGSIQIDNGGRRGGLEPAVAEEREVGVEPTIKEEHKVGVGLAVNDSHRRGGAGRRGGA